MSRQAIVSLKPTWSSPLVIGDVILQRIGRSFHSRLERGTGRDLILALRMENEIKLILEAAQGYSRISRPLNCTYSGHGVHIVLF